jgi:radical SAM-linked protein
MSLTSPSAAQGNVEEPPPPRQRIRLEYAKGEPVKFISHQDEFRLWERALRRADLPLLYKQGFNPQPHMQFAAPLGVGFTGAREPLDIILSPSLALDEVVHRVRAKLPPGVVLHSAREVALSAPAPQSLLIGADYTIILYAGLAELPRADLQARVDAFLATQEIWRERERKGRAYRYNLRPLVFELCILGYDLDAEEHHLHLRVQQRAGATGRPDEVVAALGLSDHARTLRRERLYFEDNADDCATFDPYPVVAQAEIAADAPAPRRHQDSSAACTDAPRRGGRSISERAADEFD